MGNDTRSTDPRRWPDGVFTTQADERVMQGYEQSHRNLASFSAPLLVRRDRPGSRLFVACFDGTGNDKDKYPDEITNVGILKDQIDTAERSGVTNIKAGYVPGIGTQDEELIRDLDGALGYSYGPRMEEMYHQFITQADKWIRENPNADISLAAVGFSRGAVTASLFTRMVHERGIQNPEGMTVLRNDAGEITKLIPRQPPLVPPGQTRQVLGLFDPVATGWLNRIDVRPAPSVISGMQIIAQHEHRDAFMSKQILDPGISRDGRFYSYSVGGAHCDIGGGYWLNGLAVRNGNAMAAFLNATSDVPFLPYRPVPNAPEMNVIHHSEEHRDFYITKAADITGRRQFIPLLASGAQPTLNPFDAEPADPALLQRTQYRHITPPAQILDPTLPDFFKDRPQPAPQPPRIDSWGPLFRNLPMGAVESVPQGIDPNAPSHPAASALQWNPQFLAATGAALQGQVEGIHAAGRDYARTLDGQLWLDQGRGHNQALAQQAEQERRQALAEAVAVQEAPAHRGPVMRM